MLDEIVQQIEHAGLKRHFAPVEIQGAPTRIELECREAVNAGCHRSDLARMVSGK